VENSLKSLGFNEITDTRIGKYIEMKIDTDSKEKAGEITDKACKKLLVNSIMENYVFEIFPSEN